MFRQIRLRLTVGYVGILALILILFGIIVVVGFSQQTTAQQDELLMREAESKQSLFYSDNDEDNADSDDEDNDERVNTNSTDESEGVAWAALTPDGRVIEQSSRASSLGLPSTEQVRQVARQGKTSAATTEGPDAGVRVMSVPVVQSGKVVGVFQAACWSDSGSWHLCWLLLAVFSCPVGRCDLSRALSKSSASSSATPLMSSRLHSP